MTISYDIMIAGHLCVDIIPRFPDTGLRNIADIMRPGKLVNVEQAAISTGGLVSNTGINMKTLGNKVCFCACVGDDELGQMTTAILSKSGNAEGIHTLKGQASSYTVVVAPPGIDRIFLHNPGTNNFFTTDDLNTVEGVASISSIAIDKARIYEREVTRQQQALEEKKRLNILFDSVQGGISTLDRDFIVTAANKYVEEWV